MSSEPSPRGVPLADLLTQIFSAAGRLVQGEISLLKAEARRAVIDASKGLACLVVAVVVVLLGLGWLTHAAYAGLMALKLGPMWSSLILGLLLCAIAAGLVWWGIQLLKRGPQLPKRGMDNLRRDMAAVSAGVAADTDATEADDARSL